MKKKTVSVTVLVISLLVGAVIPLTTAAEPTGKTVLGLDDLEVEILGTMDTESTVGVSLDNTGPDALNLTNGRISIQGGVLGMIDETSSHANLIGPGQVITWLGDDILGFGLVLVTVIADVNGAENVVLKTALGIVVGTFVFIIKQS